MTDKLDAATLARMRQVAEQATPGPWWSYARYDGKEGGCAIIAARTDCGHLPGNPTRGMVAFATANLNTQARQCEATARYIATFDPQTIIALLDTIEAYEAAKPIESDLRAQLEAAKTTLRNIAAITSGDRLTVSEETAWPGFQALNKIVVKVRELARAALEGQGEAR